MRKYILGIAGTALVGIGFFLSSWSSSSETPANSIQLSAVVALSPDSAFNSYVASVYDSIGLKKTGLSLPVFEKALTGYYNLKNAGKLSNREILTIADFDQASKNKRLYIIDLSTNELLMNTWVAHGQNSGGDQANYFSNTSSSYASSLGFYVTGEIYHGKHGRSMRLDGMDVGFNDQARNRAIVVHGADYVSQGAINALGRLGRSQGCPAVAPELSDKVINTINNKTVLFINNSAKNYASKFLNHSLAANFAFGTGVLS